MKCTNVTSPMILNKMLYSGSLPTFIVVLPSCLILIPMLVIKLHSRSAHIFYHYNLKNIPISTDFNLFQPSFLFPFIHVE